MDEQRMVDAILEWSENHPNFNIEFVEAMDQALGIYGYLTPAQIEGLEHIIEAFRIEV